jgi:hypothetical protein
MYIMALALILLTGLEAYGALTEKKLNWDPNTDPSIAGYRLFVREDGQSYDYSAPTWQGDRNQTACTIYVDSAKIYYYVLRAFDSSGNESGDSNEVPHTLVRLSVDGPAWVEENSSAVYTGVALFKDGTTQPATMGATWVTDSPFAHITMDWNQGLGGWLLDFSTKEVATDQVSTLKAAFAFGDETAVCYKDVLIKDRPPRDSDGDGMPDSWETTYGLNPFADDSHKDLDGDGLSNLEEYQNGRRSASGCS